MRYCPLPTRCQVTANDDMDDSDLEHQHLREKRMRKPARLWRSARERAVWLRMARDATTAYEAAYCTYILCDRCESLGWGSSVLCAAAIVPDSTTGLLATIARSSHT